MLAGKCREENVSQVWMENAMSEEPGWEQPGDEQSKARGRKGLTVS